MIGNKSLALFGPPAFLTFLTSCLDSTLLFLLSHLLLRLAPLVLDSLLLHLRLLLFLVVAGAGASEKVVCINQGGFLLEYCPSGTFRVLAFLAWLD